MHLEKFPQSEWQVGKSKIFLRGCVHEPLEEKRMKVLNGMAVKIQKTWKGQRQRKRSVFSSAPCVWTNFSHLFE
jgi:myosin heavy subunit